METTGQSHCQGTYRELVQSSGTVRAYRLYQKAYTFNRLGPKWLFDLLLHKCGLTGNGDSATITERSADISLGLEPGEFVEVKSEEEIRATFTRPGGTRGLGFMDEMWKFCGERFRVYKRLNRIMLESTAELRMMKSVVLLENNYCDGSCHYRCDRACFHFWSEAWLKRVQTDPAGKRA